MATEPRGETVRLPNGVEVLVEDSRLETLRLPRSFVQRIADVVGEEVLGYDDFRDFLLAALRSELRLDVKSSYFLKEGPR